MDQYLENTQTVSLTEEKGFLDKQVHPIASPEICGPPEAVSPQPATHPHQQPLIYQIFLSGALARFAVKRMTKCAVMAHMIAALCGSLFSFVVLCSSVWAVGYDSYRLYRGFYFTVYRDEYYYDFINPRHHGPSTTQRAFADWATPIAKGSLFLSLVLFAAALIAFVASVMALTLCCKIICQREHDSDPNEDREYDKDQGVEQPKVIILDKRGRPLQLAPVWGVPGLNPVPGQPGDPGHKTAKPSLDDQRPMNQPTVIGDVPYQLLYFP